MGSLPFLREASSSYLYHISWGRKINSGLSLYLQFILYMETMYIFLKLIEILVIISHLHLLLTYLCITYVVKTFCLWKTLCFNESSFTGQPFVRIVFFTLIFLDDQYHHLQLQNKYCYYQIANIELIWFPLSSKVFVKDRILSQALEQGFCPRPI